MVPGSRFQLRGGKCVCGGESRDISYVEGKNSGDISNVKFVTVEMGKKKA